MKVVSPTIGSLLAITISLIGTITTLDLQTYRGSPWNVGHTDPSSASSASFTDRYLVSQVKYTFFLSPSVAQHTQSHNGDSTGLCIVSLTSPRPCLYVPSTYDKHCRRDERWTPWKPHEQELAHQSGCQRSVRVLLLLHWTVHAMRFRMQTRYFHWLTAIVNSKQFLAISHRIPCLPCHLGFGKGAPQIRGGGCVAGGQEICWGSVRCWNVCSERKVRISITRHSPVALVTRRYRQNNRQSRSEITQPSSNKSRQSAGPCAIIPTPTTHIPAEFARSLQRLAILCSKY